MATKDNEGGLKKSFRICNPQPDNQFCNLNLNQNHKGANFSLFHSKSKSLNYDKKLVSGDTVIDNYQESSKSWNKSIKNFSLKTLNVLSLSDKVEEKENKKRWKNGDSENSNANSSTLSLHIAAYENSAQHLNKNEDLSQKFKATKSLNILSKLENSFEIPRQMKGNEPSTPQIMQFSASQKLLNPNQSTASYRYPNMGYNRKERLKIASKLGKQKNEKNRPTNSSISWRLKNLQHKSKKEERTLQEHEELHHNRNVGQEEKEEETMDIAPAVVKSEAIQNYNQRKGYKLSVAFPGSILNNAQGPELKTYLAGQIARTCAVFCVDEVVIFDETSRMTENQKEAYYSGAWVGMENINSKNVECNFHMARILEYLECPQYLRKYLFPMQRPLNYSGVLNPLDGMHHLRADNLTIPYREGIVLDKPVKDPKRVLCDVGLDKELELEADYAIPPKTRITVKMAEKTAPKRYFGKLSSPKAVMEDVGIYWGYNVRLAKSLSDAMNNYDIVIGTSERGVPIREANIPPVKNQRVIIVFGGLQGLESALDADEEINETDPAKIFPIYVNSLPGQGSRVIRTEEAIPITLSLIKDKLENL